MINDISQADRLGLILESVQAIKYLEHTPEPRFEIALQIADGNKTEIVELVQSAVDNLESALSILAPK